MPARTIILLVAVCLLLRLPAAVIFGGEVGDIRTYRDMAEIVLRGENIYHYRVLFPYTPLTLPLPAASLLLAQMSGLPFDLLVKLWPIAADCGLTVLVWRAALRLGRAPASARTLGLLYALNPVAILTSAFHGNQITLAVLFAFWAYTVAGEDGEERGYPRAGLLLGIGIAVRSFPLLLLPVFLVLLPFGAGAAAWRRRAIFTGLALLPAVLVSIPALLLDAPAYLRETLVYHGFIDQGWMAIRRAWGVVSGTSGAEAVPPPATLALLDASKWLFLALYGGLIAWLARQRRAVSLAAGCLLAWLLFLIAYGGVSTHYLVWVVPFGLLGVRRPAVLYSLTAAAAMIGFYLTWFPAILLGQYAPATANTPLAWQIYLVTLVVSWSVSVGWFLYTLAGGNKKSRPFML
jgi:4-amino-4-deoxy-L-arabinose transferase-like glycosyltransferase